MCENQNLIDLAVRQMMSKAPAWMDWDDATSAASLALINAASKWRSDGGASFKTYALYRLRGAILDSWRVNDWVPRSVRAKGGGIKIHSLHVPMRDNAGEEQTLDVASLDPLPEDALLRQAANTEIRRVFFSSISELTPKNQYVMEAYYFHGRQMKEIGTALGVSESRISQITSQFVGLLQQKMKEHIHA